MSCTTDNYTIFELRQTGTSSCWTYTDGSLSSNSRRQYIRQPCTRLVSISAPTYSVHRIIIIIIPTYSAATVQRINIIPIYSNIFGGNRAHGSFLFRRQRGHPALFYRLFTSNSADHWEGMQL